MLTIFNHNLTEEQRNDAIKNFNVTQFITLPENLKKLWMNIPPEKDLSQDIISKIKSWILANANKGDFILVQGEFGISFYIVNFCFKQKFIPVYATTKRISQETKKKDGSIKKINIFKHVQFRRYINEY